MGNLEEIFWNEKGFINREGYKLILEERSIPVSLNLRYKKDAEEKIIEKFINKNVNYRDLDIYTYCKGICSKEDTKIPIQFYKIKIILRKDKPLVKK